jgi:hypothetical protein
MLASIQFFDIVLAVHIAAVVITFGVVFTYPLVMPWARRTHPEAVPAIHAMQAHIGKNLISPGMVVILAAGVYLASKLDVWSETWVTVPLVILIILGGLGGTFFGPNEVRLAKMAATTPSSPEYEALAARVLRVQFVAMALVLVAIFFMVVKP